MSNVIPFDPNLAPAAFKQQKAAGHTLAQDLTAGLAPPLDFLSIKGKAFTMRLSDQTIRPIPPTPVFQTVIIASRKELSKAYYTKVFQEGVNMTPDCWSRDGIRPDPGVAQKQNDICLSCRWNQFGTAMQGKGKACRDSRQTAVFNAAWLLQSQAPPLLLRVPATSLAALAEYGSKLDGMGLGAEIMVTELSFDYTVAHQKLIFTPVRVLTDDEYRHMVWLRDNDQRVKRMLSDDAAAALADADQDMGNAATQQPQQQAAPQTPAGWTPPQPQPQPFAQAPQPAAPAPAPEPVQPAPAAAQAAPPVDPEFEAFQKWKAAQAAASQPAPQPAAAPVTPGVAQPFQGQPFQPAQQPNVVPGPGWAPPNGGGQAFGDADVPEFLRKNQAPAQPQPQPEPSFTGPVIDGTATEVKAEDKPEPKKRKPPAQPPADPTSGVAAASQSLDDVLQGIMGGGKPN